MGSDFQRYYNRVVKYMSLAVQANAARSPTPNLSCTEATLRAPHLSFYFVFCNKFRVLILPSPLSDSR